MTNKRLHRAFRAWVRQRPGGFSGFVATICLMGAAILTLSQALGHRVRSNHVATSVLSQSPWNASQFDDDRWRDELSEISRKLEVLLVRTPEYSETFNSTSN